MLIAKNIKRYRLEKGWTQQELAEEIGTTKGVILNYENGEIPSPQRLQLLAAVFGVRIEDLTFGDLDGDLSEADEKYNTGNSQIVRFLIDELKEKNKIISALLQRLTNGNS